MDDGSWSLFDFMNLLMNYFDVRLNIIHTFNQFIVGILFAFQTLYV